MNRAGVSFIVLAAALTAACGGAEGVDSSPTGPSSTTTTVPSQPQPSCMPSAPANLRVTAIQGTVVSLAWSAVSGATEYLVLVGTSPGNSDALFTNTAQTNYTWTAKEGRQYARIQAKNSCGTSGSSNEVEFTAG